jgi:hypothetical protein
MRSIYILVKKLMHEVHYEGKGSESFSYFKVAIVASLEEFYE